VLSEQDDEGGYSQQYAEAKENAFSEWALDQNAIGHDDPNNGPQKGRCNGDGV